MATRMSAGCSFVFVTHRGALALLAATASMLAVSTAAPALPPLQEKAGRPLRDLTPNQRVMFRLGREAYERPFTPSQGLGPAFNATNCGACHEQPLGGWGVIAVEHFARVEGETFDYLEEFGGPVRQQLAIPGGCAELRPDQANHVRMRVTPSVLAFGLVEALTDAALLANADPADADGDGISGRAHMVGLLESPSSPLRVGRFGWKAQLATVRSFTGDAGRTEMGITNEVVGDETAPGGDGSALEKCDAVSEPEDLTGEGGMTFVDAASAFQRYLAPPPQAPRAGMHGESVFNAIGCVKCHVRTFMTPNDPLLEPALRGKTIHPYSDFLLHDMGDMLADGIGDGIPDGGAQPFEMRTPPLWNLRDRPLMLHDGSADDEDFEIRVEQAIVRHGGEGAASREAWNALAPADKLALVDFLDSLGRREFDLDGDGEITGGDYGILSGYLGRTDISPDEPGAVADVNANGAIDGDEWAYLAQFAGAVEDCNQNGIDDFAEIANGTSLDSDSNGIPDECDAATLCGYRVIRITQQVNQPLLDFGNPALVSTVAGVNSIDTGRVVKLNLSLDMSHTWVSDVVIKLASLNGGVVVDEKNAFAGTNCSGGCSTSTGNKFAANMDGIYRFERDAALPAPCAATTYVFSGCNGANCNDCAFLPPGRFRTASTAASGWFDGPSNQPSNFRLESSWRLTVSDDRPEDVGFLRSWTLDIVYAPDSFSPEEDCDGDGLPNDCDEDLDFDGESDVCEQIPEPRDCNRNGIFDDVEIFEGTVDDCDENNVPDACQADSDGDHVIDACDLCPNNSESITPDECGCTGGDAGDADGDGTPNCVDGCPNDATKTTPGLCGCGVPETDSDGDGVANCNDGCPNDPTKIAPGACGCGSADTDSDSDGTPNCNDGCPNDPAKTAPGACGCGTADTDSDSDGKPNCNDGCPNDPTKTAPGGCGCGVADVDTDGDGRLNCVDNCPSTANASQADCDGDGVGDACDPAQNDCNANGVEDSCDIASGFASDANGDGVPDSCAGDCDGDGIPDAAEIAGGAADCNGNGLPDSCDLAVGSSTDLNGNGIPDDASCGDFVVGGSGYASIAAAIAAAPNGSTISVAPGVFTGPLTIQGKRLTLRSIGGAAATILDGTGLDTAILVVSGSAANGTVVEGFTFRNGSQGAELGEFRVGGAMLIDTCAANVVNCVFTSNAAPFGAAIYGRTATTTLHGCTFAANNAGEMGGALLFGLGSTVLVDGCAFAMNSAGDRGGAIHTWNSFVDIVDSTFDDNAASIGGAIAWFAESGGPLSIDNCRFEANIALSCVVERVGGFLEGTVVDTLFCRNEGGCDIGEGFLDEPSNRFGGDCDDDGICDLEELDADPSLDCDGDGVLNNCEIEAGAPDCNGNGRPDSCDLASGSSTDLDANGRLDDCAGEFVVGGSGFTSIQAAIDAAPNGATISVSAGSYGVIDLTGRALTVRSIGGAAQTFIDGGSSTRCILMLGAGPGATVVRGFTLRNGRAEDGAAVALTLSSPLFENCVFTGNIATGRGGAVAARSSAARFIGCTFSQNSAASGGAIWTEGSAATGEVLLKNSIFTNNMSASIGGAVRNEAPLRVEGCDFDLNTAVISGGGASFLSQGTAQVLDTYFCRNAPNNIQGTFGDLGGNILSTDCDGDGNCDFDEIAAGQESDCNANGVLDSCDIANGSAVDCNGNDRPDSCDLADGTATDVNGNGVPDICESVISVPGNFPTIEAALNSLANGSQATILVGPGTYSLTGTSNLTITGKRVVLKSVAGPTQTIIDGSGLAGVSMLVIDPSIGATAAEDEQLQQWTAGTVIEGFTFRNGRFGTGAGVRKGGAIYINAIGGTISQFIEADIRNCIFRENTAEFGGAIYARGLRGTIALCDFFGNEALQEVPGNPSSGGDGGAVQFFRGRWVFRDNTVIGNDAQRIGGGLHLVGPFETCTVERCDLSANSAPISSAISWAQAGTPASNVNRPITILDSRLVGNIGPGDAALGSNSNVLCFQLQGVVLCNNDPANFSGLACYADLGGTYFSSDCDGDGVCDIEEILAGDEEDGNSNGIPDSCDAVDCVADLNCDGVVNAADLTILLLQWNQDGPLGDINGDGIVNAADVTSLLLSWTP